ncbi:unnamed protein product [Agarophyton chilense]
MLDDPDSDTELLCHSGGSKIVSYYDRLTNNANIDDNFDDDEDDNFDVLAFASKPPKKRPRGRTPKKGSQPPHKKLATEDKTVFEISDDDEVVVVATSEKLDKEDIEAKLAAQRARNLLAESTKDNSDMDEAIRVQEEARLEREAAVKRKQDAERTALEKRQRSKPEGIIFKARHGNQIKKVRMRTTDPLRKLLPRFCTDFGLDLKKVYMEFDGEEVGPEETPESIELEQDMIVDLYVRGSRR